LAGITAFRGARETSLWFLDGAGKAVGILADARPAEFWALADLAPGDDGVRVRSATGRTCTVVLTRCPDPRTTPIEESDEDDGEETEFQMIEGREREGIMEWVRRHKSAFGIAAAQGAGPGPGDKGAGSGAGAENGVVAREGDSDSGSDFEQESGESDGGSPSSGVSSSDAGEREGSDGSDNEGDASEGVKGSVESEGDDGSDGDDDDDGGKFHEDLIELNRKRPPLVGGAAAVGALPTSRIPTGLSMQHNYMRGHEDDEEGEESDELED